ncbi:MAG: hypothetical protein GOMPHAMPRED_004666 [Gomphillus americanus]|uniref:Uncharacterized protein n=1 Tax=Gomphillus americanus TaxID=1940652 RepID=A0A8H3IUF4_9LECA|nr:MAG: hypothetical protein GOMPHAMPRED_004666 [Gomphillus americanus]
MKAFAGFPPLIIWLVTVHAYFNKVSFLLVDDVNNDKVVGHDGLDKLLSISTPRQDDGYEELLRRSHWAQRESKPRSVQRRDLNIRPSRYQSVATIKHMPTPGLLARSGNHRPIQEPIIPQGSSRPLQSLDRSSLTGLSTRSAELQETSIRLHTRTPPNDSPGQGSRDSRSVSPSRSQQRPNTPSDQGQQRALTNRRRVHVLQPLTLETLAQLGAQHSESQNSEHDRVAAINSNGSSPRHRQQQQRQRTNPNQPTSSPANVNRSRQRAQTQTEYAGSPRRSSSMSSLARKSDRSTPIPESTNHDPEVESRYSNQDNELMPLSPSRASPGRRRRRREEERNEASASITTSRRSTGEQGDGGVANGAMSTSLSEAEPSTRRRRLQRRSSKHDNQRIDHSYAAQESHLHNRNTRLMKRGLMSSSFADSALLLRRGSKKNSKSNRSGSQGRRSRPSSMSASSSTSSLQTSKSAVKLSDVSQESQKETKAGSPTDRTQHDPSSSQPRGQSSQTGGRHKSRQNSQALPRANAYLYGKMSGRKLKPKTSSPTQDDIPSRSSPVKLRTVGTGGELTRASSTTSFNSVMSRTWSEMSFPDSPSGSSVKSWFSAKSGTSAGPPGSPRVSLPSSPVTSPPGSPRASLSGSPKANRPGSPSAGPPGSPRTSHAGPSISDAGSISKSHISESPRSSIARTQVLRALSMPRSPFAITRPLEAQSVPSSPSTHHRPSPFANAHSRSYSAPELAFYDQSSSRIHAPHTPLSRESSTASSRVAAPVTQAGSLLSTLSRLALGTNPRSHSPLSAVSWRTQTPMSRTDSNVSVSSPLWLHTVDAAAPDLPPSPAPDQASSSREGNNALPAAEGRRLSIEMPRRLDPVVAPPRSFPFGPVGSPVHGSPVLGAPRSSWRRD